MGRVSPYTSDEGEDDPCHQLMGVHPFAQQYPLLQQKSEVVNLILLKLSDEILVIWFIGYFL